MEPELPPEGEADSMLSMAEADLLQLGRELRGNLLPGREARNRWAHDPVS